MNELVQRLHRIGEAYGEDWKHLEEAEGLETAVSKLICDQFDEGLRERGRDGMPSDNPDVGGLRGKTTEELIRLVRAWMPGLPDPHLRSREALIEAMRDTDYWAMEGDDD